MSQVMPDEFWQGVEQFNQKQFYACHDTLEALWMEATEPEKTFYQGILQVAVALYHLSNSNFRGAVILLGEGINRLRRYPSTYAGIDVDELLNSSAVLLTTLQQAGQNKIAEHYKVDNNALAKLAAGITSNSENPTLCLPSILRVDA